MVATPVLEFGEFRLDCCRFELSRAGRNLKLERKPMELLILLAGRNGRVVSRDDIEHGINTAVRKIPQVLRDDPEEPRFVQTVTGKGYRFIAPILELEAELAGKQVSIAVLPFANVSAEKENEYFGDGLAEEIMNQLANVAGMKVASRISSFSFKQRDVEPPEIGKRLNVDYILEGSVRSLLVWESLSVATRPDLRSHPLDGTWASR
jgi:DNA-binding winged helix-turn-helix (wHTH) protein